MAARYWVGGNANWDATAGTKWALTSGGAGGQAVPTSSDDVFLDNGAGTGNVTLASGYAATCKTIVCTGYVGTLASADATGSLTVAGTITFVAGMTLSCTNLLKPNTTATLTAGGKTWGGAITFDGTSGARTYTLADNWVVTGTMIAITGGTQTINGNTLTVAGCDITGINNLAGTTSLVFGGTGTWKNTSTGVLSMNTTINTAGTLTVSGTVYWGAVGATLLYTAGTVTTTGSTLSLGKGGGTSCALNTNGVYWESITNAAGSHCTITNNSALKCVNLKQETAGANYTWNGSAIEVTGSLTSITNTGIVGTCAITMTGTGTLSTSTGAITNNLTINTVGTITLGTTVTYGTGILTYTAGTIVNTSSTLNLTSSCTLNTGGMTWGSVTTLNITHITITLTSNWNMGSLSMGGSVNGSNQVINGLYNVNVGGSLTINNNVGISGTASLVLNGTGTWSHNSTGPISNNLTINTAGTITITGNVYYRTGTFTYTAGTVSQGTSTLNIGTTTTFNTNGMSFYNITVSATSTQTLNSLLTATGTLSLTGSTTFAGTYGWTTSRFTCTTAGTTITLVAAKTYTITSTMTCTGTAASRITIISTTTTKAILTLQGNVTQANVYLNGTYIDSSLGNTVWTYLGTLSNTINWNNTPLQPSALSYGFIV